MANHPKALPFLFLTEMWERFGFYVVQGMLILYMTQAFNFSDDQSYTILGVFTALAYISPMIGGFLADVFLGFKQAIFWGGAFLIAGYALMAIPDPHLLYVALATIIVGNGLFKPNISSLLGALYPVGDTNRDAGFTLFYIGINLGVLLAGVSSGAIKNHFGWHAGFGVASIGLLFGLGVFTLGLKYGNIRLTFRAALDLKKSIFLSRPALFIYCLIAIFCISLLLQSSLLGKWLLPTVGMLLLFFLYFLAARQPTEDRKRLYMLNILVVSAVIFWMLYLQMFFSINLFIDRLIDKHILGMNIPTTVFYALESVFIILLGPVMAWSWQKLNQWQCNPSPLIKFTLAIIFAGIGFLILALGTYFANAAGLMSALWIVFSYLMITVGELLLSPIGLSAVTLLSPPRLTGMMMGVWFVALGFGGEFAGWLAKLSSIPEDMNDGAAQLVIYRHAFMDYAYVAAGVAILLIAAQVIFRKWIKQSSVG